MTDRRAIFQGEWRRFSKYQILNGYIRPAEGSTLEVYDPWSRYYDERFATTRGTIAYQDLLKIGKEAQRQFSAGKCLFSGGMDAQVLQFCQDYGLLGSLLQRVHQVILAPKFDVLPELYAEHLQKNGMSYEETQKAKPSATRYRRDSFGGWAQDSIINFDSSPDALKARSWPTPGVLLQVDFDKPELTTEDLRTTWAKYFPDVIETDWETYQYPTPSSDEFWVQYAEPLSTFLSAAGIFFKLCDGISVYKGMGTNCDSRPGKLFEFLRKVNAVTASVCPVLQYSNGDFRQVWKSPSLLAMLVMMLVTDLAGHYQLLSCEKCGYIFPTKSYQGRFCSERCRSGFHKQTPRPAASHGIQ